MLGSRCRNLERDHIISCSPRFSPPARLYVNTIGKFLSNMEWYDWAIPLVTLVLGGIIHYLRIYFRCKEYCEFWKLDFKEEWRKVRHWK